MVSLVCVQVCGRQDLHSQTMTPKAPYVLSVHFHLCIGRSECAVFLSGLGTLEYLTLTSFLHFFPTPLVTLDLECRFLLLEEWLSWLLECFGGLSSEPAQRKPTHYHQGLWALWLTPGV